MEYIDYMDCTRLQGTQELYDLHVVAGGLGWVGEWIRKQFSTIQTQIHLKTYRT